MGYSKLMFVFFMLYHLMLSGNFYSLEIQLGIFLVLNFGSRIFLGFVGSPRDFLDNFSSVLVLANWARVQTSDPLIHHFFF